MNSIVLLRPLHHLLEHTSVHQQDSNAFRLPHIQVKAYLSKLLLYKLATGFTWLCHVLQNVGLKLTCIKSLIDIPPLIKLLAQCSFRCPLMKKKLTKSKKNECHCITYYKYHKPTTSNAARNTMTSKTTKSFHNSSNLRSQDQYFALR